MIRKNSENGHTQHGYRIEASPLVVLNALGFIGFKVIAVAGTFQVEQSYNFQLSFTVTVLNEELLFSVCLSVLSDF